MIVRRGVVLGAAALAGCGLSTRPYVERREWPLDPVRPPGVGAGRGVLLIRTVRAGPAVVVRGLQTLRPDGSVTVGFYDEWLASPAELFEQALRQWFADSRRFAAVVAPGARLDADAVLECELAALLADPGHGEARCDVSMLLTRERRVAVQRTLAGRAPLAGNADPAARARAMRAAAGDACAQIERAVG